MHNQGSQATCLCTKQSHQTCKKPPPKRESFHLFGPPGLLRLALVPAVETPDKWLGLLNLLWYNLTFRKTKCFDLISVNDLPGVPLCGLVSYLIKSMENNLFCFNLYLHPLSHQLHSSTQLPFKCLFLVLVLLDPSATFKTTYHPLFKLFKILSLLVSMMLGSLSLPLSTIDLLCQPFQVRLSILGFLLPVSLWPLTECNPLLIIMITMIK